MEQLDAHMSESVATGFVAGIGTPIRSLNSMADDVSPTDIAVLIFGESGTGKDAYARHIHRLSQKEDSLFWKINCSAVDPGNLLAQINETVVAISQRDSFGSIYLDNLQELDQACQRVLLSHLPEKESTGSKNELRARFISSTTKNLESELGTGRFQRELYFRLNGVCLRLPALRERTEDIAVLMECFLTKHGGAAKKKIPQLNRKALQTLASYHWPGNIRELENLARKIIMFGDVQMALNDLQAARIVNIPSDGMRVSSLKVAARAASQQAERELIRQALERTRWNRKRAASELQISYKSLLYKIKQIGPLNEEQKG
ncbi:MAG: hypothetical protein PVS2B2_25390 [Candidatus Acidiferrum sp.]